MTTAAPANTANGPPSILYSGQALFPGGDLRSPNGRFTLTLQSDGNLVLYDPYSRAIWATNTAGHPNVTQLVMQVDGNLVLYENTNQPYWATNTAGQATSPLLFMQSDGNLVCYTTGEQPYWSSNTQVPVSPNVPANSNVLNPGEGLGVGNSLTSDDGVFHLTVQSDGNLVEYKQTDPVWASNTTDSLAWCLTMQADGNLVLYDVHQAPLWASNTGGNPGVGMIIQDDGNMCIYPIGGTVPIFATGQK